MSEINCTHLLITLDSSNIKYSLSKLQENYLIRNLNRYTEGSQYELSLETTTLQGVASLTRQAAGPPGPGRQHLVRVPTQGYRK
jgi:hypothetical protein